MKRRRKRNGAWGTGPLDSDGAADWLAAPMKQVAGHIESALVQEVTIYNVDDIRAAAWLLQQTGYRYAYPIDKLDEHVVLAVQKLETILRFEEWIGSWDEPKSVQASLMQQIDALKLRLYDIDSPGSTSLREVLQAADPNLKLRKKLLR